MAREDVSLEGWPTVDVCGEGKGRGEGRGGVQGRGGEGYRGEEETVWAEGQRDRTHGLTATSHTCTPRTAVTPATYVHIPKHACTVTLLGPEDSSASSAFTGHQTS